MRPAEIKTEKIDLAIADDHTLFRQSLKGFFSTLGNINVKIEASDYSELLIKLTTCKTEIILMDLNLPDLHSSINAISQILVNIPRAKILIVTMSNDNSIKQRLFNAGIYSYIHKGADIEYLIERIMIASSQVHASQVNHTANNPIRNRHNVEKINKITFSQREKIILKLIIDGKTNSEISKTVFLSVRSIEEIRHGMKERANVKNTVALVEFAIRNQLLED